MFIHSLMCWVTICHVYKNKIVSKLLTGRVCISCHKISAVTLDTWKNRFWRRVVTRWQHHEGTNGEARDRKPGITVFCIWGRQCALCPWVGSGTLLRLSPRPAVNLKRRRSWEKGTGGRVTHCSLSFLLWIFIFPLPHDDTSPFSFSLTYMNTSPASRPLFAYFLLRNAAGGVGSRGQEVFQNWIQSTHGMSDVRLALKVQDLCTHFGQTHTVCTVISNPDTYY